MVKQRALGELFFNVEDAKQNSKNYFDIFRCVDNFRILDNFTIFKRAAVRYLYNITINYCLALNGLILGLMNQYSNRTREFYLFNTYRDNYNFIYLYTRDN